MRDVRILLGSSSSYRKKILTDMFPDREIEFLAPDIDEKAVALSLNCTRDESPPDLLTQEIALAKARKCIDILAQRKEDSDTRRYCIITGDQVAVFRGKIREKPSSEKEALEWMSEYSNSKIDLCASVVITLFDPQSRREISQSKGSVFSSQSFKYIPKEAIQELIVDGGIMQNCGGFTVTDPRMAPFLSSRSGSIDEIIGFPISLTNRLMAEIIHDAPEI